jgi:hypothetical protein
LTRLENARISVEMDRGTIRICVMTETQVAVTVVILNANKNPTTTVEEDILATKISAIGSLLLSRMSLSMLGMISFWSSRDLFKLVSYDYSSITSVNGKIDDSDFEISLVIKEQGQRLLNWTILQTDLPSSFIYIYLTLNETIRASSYYDNVR